MPTTCSTSSRQSQASHARSAASSASFRTSAAIQQLPGAAPSRSAWRSDPRPWLAQIRWADRAQRRGARRELGRWISTTAQSPRSATTCSARRISVRYAGFPSADHARSGCTDAAAARQLDPAAILLSVCYLAWSRGPPIIDQASRRAPAAGKAPTILNRSDWRRCCPPTAPGAVHRPYAKAVRDRDRAWRPPVFGSNRLSRYYGGKLSFLEISGDRVVPHNFERGMTPPRRQVSR